jgi:hypothetical protein
MIKAFAAFVVTALIASSPFAAAACEPSQLVKNGCHLVGDDGSGVDVHYALSKNDSLVSFAIRAQTRGYVSIAFVNNGQDAMFPSDAVVGWAGESNSVMGYAVNGYEQKDVVGSGIVLTNTSTSEIAGVTTVRFTRLTKTGRFPIDPAYVTFNLAQGPTDGLTKHTKESTVAANLLTGKRLPLVPEAYPPPVAPGSPAPPASPPVILPSVRPPTGAAAALSTVALSTVAAVASVVALLV